MYLIMSPLKQKPCQVQVKPSMPKMWPITSLPRDCIAWYSWLPDNIDTFLRSFFRHNQPLCIEFKNKN